ncbi:ferric reductase-like transmembrane domain-containing protein [Streptomyces albus]|uniref:ferric reductase-like transmembrane domain-containing protein n=1 Tax=Streptomyces albus TaxID=1888 RepID=UPI00068A1B69|nr:ferric reductase-like transmembrane domain-containing protein [Streptomyces albus]
MPSLPKPAASQTKVFAASVALLLVVPLVLALATGDRFRAFLDFGAGVLSLLTLTASVVWGLIAAHRLLLNPRDRLLAQGVHRAVAVASLGFLVVHVAVKVSLDHAPLIAALIPFSLGITGAGGLIGMGSMAAYLMVIAGSTGALRSTFVPNREVAGRWRAIHAVAYPSWCFAVLHGLYAGRPAAGWVTAMYGISLLAVGLAVAARLLPQPQRRRIARLVLSVMQPDADTGRRSPAADGEGARRDTSVSPLPGAGARPRGAAASAPASAGGRDEMRPPLDSTRAVPIGSGLGSGLSAGYRAMASDQTSGGRGDPLMAPAAGSQGFAEAPTRQMPAYPDSGGGTGGYGGAAGYGGPDGYGGGWGGPGGPAGQPLTGSVTGSVTGQGDPSAEAFPRQAGDPLAGRGPDPLRDPLTEPFPGVTHLASSERWPTPSPPPPAPAENLRPAPQPDPLTDTSTGFSYPPPPGEPWQETAGGRP